MIRLSSRSLVRVLTMAAAAVTTVAIAASAAEAQGQKRPVEAPKQPPTPQGFRESGTRARPAAPVDINRATAAELETVPGIGKAYAARIIAGRPYANKAQLVQKGVLTQGLYDKIKDRLIAKQ